MLNPNRTLIYSENLSLEYIENFFDSDQCRSYMTQLTDRVRWGSEKIKIWGKEIVTNRKIAWYADAGKSYTYSGSTFFPTQWNGVLLQLKRRVEEYAKLNLIVSC